MSTRGAVGIRYNGEDKVGYNHSDSYTADLGKSVLTWLKTQNLKNLKDFYSIIQLTDDANNDVWDSVHDRMYEQFEDYHEFLYNSLFCEYAYIINLDTQKLEFYIGKNKDPNAAGRYANYYVYDDDHRYCGVKLVQTFPLKDIFAGEITVENFNY